MPTTIDEEKMKTMQVLDLSKPQGYAQGLPIKQIGHLEYPKCIYKHPTQPFREVLHRNAKHEVVHSELVATEHLVHACQDEAEYNKLLSQGWVAEPYIPQAPPDLEEQLYSPAVAEVVKRAAKKQASDESDGR